MTTIPKNIVYKQVGDELVLLDFELGVYYGLDPVGARIWQLLTEAKSEPEIVEALLAEYDATRETLQADVARLLADLRDKGLLT